MKTRIFKIAAFAMILLFGVLAARQVTISVMLSREEQLIENLIRGNKSRLEDVRLVRMKPGYNMLEGQVNDHKDLDFIRSELQRLKIKRCAVLVTASEPSE